MHFMNVSWESICNCNTYKGASNIYCCCWKWKSQKINSREFKSGDIEKKLEREWNLKRVEMEKKTVSQSFAFARSIVCSEYVCGACHRGRSFSSFPKKDSYKDERTRRRRKKDDQWIPGKETLLSNSVSYDSSDFHIFEFLNPLRFRVFHHTGFIPSDTTVLSLYGKAL